MLAALVAITAAFLPSRWWSRFPAIQIERCALLAALTMMPYEQGSVIRRSVTFELPPLRER